jgi:hypothetical protein
MFIRSLAASALILASLPCFAQTSVHGPWVIQITEMLPSPTGSRSLAIRFNRISGEHYSCEAHYSESANIKVTALCEHVHTSAGLDPSKGPYDMSMLSPAATNVHDTALHWYINPTTGAAAACVVDRGIGSVCSEAIIH